MHLLADGAPCSEQIRQLESGELADVSANLFTELGNLSGALKDRKQSRGPTSFRRSRTIRNLRRCLKRFRYVTPSRAAADLARAIGLHRSEPAITPVAARTERLVVSMTTVPQRIGSILPALRSLLDQTCAADKIVLALPSHSLRAAEPYPAVPPLPARVEILHCEDHGPATKLLPVLRREPDATIVAVDDDVIYPRDFLETLLEAHRRQPRCAVGYRGCDIEPNIDPRDFNHVFATALRTPRSVDLLLGTWGYLVPPRAFDEAVYDFSGFPDPVRWVDDIWFSGHLARRKLPRYVIQAKGFPIETTASYHAALTDGPNRTGKNDTAAIELFAPWW